MIKKINAEIKNAFRIGKTLADKTRPLIHTMNDTETKRNILQNAKKLKGNSKYSEVSIKPDLTKCQQEEQKSLFLEFKRRRENREQVLLRGGSIAVLSRTNNPY